MELNPNHPTASTTRELWHKIAAVLVDKAGGHAVITHSDIENIQNGAFITVQEQADGLHLRLVDEATAYRLAREHGGLPV